MIDGEKGLAMVWQPIESAPQGVVVETKIDDEHGIRNEQKLYLNGRLWWIEDGKMYVYYQPTHWRPTKRPTSR